MLEIDEVESFLTTLKPLYHTLIEYIEFCEIKSCRDLDIPNEIICQFSDFLEGKPIHYLEMPDKIPMKEE